MEKTESTRLDHNILEATRTTDGAENSLQKDEGYPIKEDEIPVTTKEEKSIEMKRPVVHVPNKLIQYMDESLQKRLSIIREKVNHAKAATVVPSPKDSPK